MKLLIKAIEDQGIKKAGKKILSFKEFCQYVYEPTQRIKALNLPEEERLELEKIISERLGRQVH